MPRCIPNRLLKYATSQQFFPLQPLVFPFSGLHHEIGHPFRPFFLRFKSVFLASLAPYTACRRVSAKVRIRIKFYAAIVSTNIYEKKLCQLRIRACQQAQAGISRRDELGGAVGRAGFVD